GGTGGAKLARGVLDLAGDDLVVIANTGDDIEIYGAYVSPDPDLVTFWLADRIDERGWGLAEDTFAVMDGLRALGVDVWFNLGDQDLAIGLERARRLGKGERLTEAHAAITAALGVRARVLPMSDRPVRTWVRAHGHVWPFQEFMIRGDGKGPIEDVDVRGARSAHPTDDVLGAIASASAIIIGPSNPIISIGPILALTGLCEALAASPAPVVAVSPFVRGEVVKGPTKEFMASADLSPDAAGIAIAYEGVIDGLLADDRTDRVPVLQTDVLMADGAGRRRVAEEALRFAAALG
ncbi:MAG TPA: 2-phospho-L-lactate transferase CofD family protein, partial [Solirubrobacteraceae bacterium]